MVVHKRGSHGLSPGIGKMALRTAVEEMVSPDREGTDGVIIIKVRTLLILDQTIVTVMRFTIIGSSEHTIRNYIERRCYPASRLHEILIVDCSSGIPADPVSLFRKQPAEFPESQHRSLIEGNMTVMDKPSPVCTGVEISGNGYAVDKRLLLTLQKLTSEIHGRIPVPVFRKTFIQQGR